MEPMLPSVPPNGGPHAEWIAGRVKVLLSHYYQPEIAPEVEEEGLADWIESLLPFPHDAIAQATRAYLRDQPRRRPTPGDIRGRAAELSKPKQRDNHARGDRYKLTHDELAALSAVLATARRWTQTNAVLAAHGAATLEHWGEPVPSPNMLPKSREVRA